MFGTFGVLAGSSANSPVDRAGGQSPGPGSPEFEAVTTALTGSLVTVPEVRTLPGAGGSTLQGVAHPGPGLPEFRGRGPALASIATVLAGDRATALSVRARWSGVGGALPRVSDAAKARGLRTSAWPMVPLRDRLKVEPAGTPTMPARNVRKVALTNELARFVDGLVADGAYNNASEVVRDALRELRQRRYADQVTEIRARIGGGLAQLDRGEGRGGAPATVLGELRTKSKRPHGER